MKCRHCTADITLPFIDLGSAPPSNSYLNEKALSTPEKWYPLRVLVCTECWLVQTEDYADCADLFSSTYAYFSSFSNSWLQHAEHYVSAMAERFDLNENSLVIELASNDGYLLQYVKSRNIPCLGIEPTSSTAQVARSKGIEVIESFFGRQVAQQLANDGRRADLITANNVLAHVPDINDFVAGIALLLKPNGVATFEFPHLLKLVQECQFDTIYHEHFSYLSLTAITNIFAKNGLLIFDVENLSTHGGSLRVYAQRSDAGRREISSHVHEIQALEIEAGTKSIHFYSGLQAKADSIKDAFLSFLIEAKKSNKKVAAYGAAAKGNTLMNYAGIRPDLISFVADRNPAKQGMFMPGSRIPITNEAHLSATKPDYIVLLPWNLKSELRNQLHYVKAWGGKLVTAIPHLEVE